MMPRNVALIVLDTVRQDYFSDYATRLQSMSDVSFSQCRAASSCSVPSHASILTGKLPHVHGIHSAAVDYSQLDVSETFIGDFPAHRTIGVSTNTFAGTPFGFDGLFDEFVDVSWTRRFPKGLDVREFVSTTDASGLSFYTDFLSTAVRHSHPIATLSNAGLAQLDLIFSRLPVPKLFDDGGSAALKIARERIESGSEPFFLFVNLMEAHTPHQPIRGYDRTLYDVPYGWNSMEGISQWKINREGLDGQTEAISYFRQLYAAAIEYLDRIVAAFIRDVQAVTDHETSVVITADHGENLGYPADDTMVGHTSSLSEGLLHVPLTAINPPAGYASVERKYVSHLKLGTFLSGLAQDRTPAVSGNRIAAERITTTNTPNVDRDEQRYWKRMLRCVYESEKKWVWDSIGECTRYDLDTDRANWQRLASSETPDPPDWANEFFRESIDEFRQRADEHTDREVTEATKARLRELGYL